MSVNGLGAALKTAANVATSVAGTVGNAVGTAAKTMQTLGNQAHGLASRGASAMNAAAMPPRQSKLPTPAHTPSSSHGAGGPQGHMPQAAVKANQQAANTNEKAMGDMMKQIENASMLQMKFQAQNAVIQSVTKMAEAAAKQTKAVGQGVAATGAQ
ncbi:hypothetical protein [Eleftheria terrae]|uniref:hypothetical protein n=1 Tax=Eleftheria terrae TaxID=1597781 RepID=UPI00263A8202|nr:hypothetical protein [Eleftheria terrae]WKB51729.1 hypothetical protein N7L95_18270 [Eleftheria terrae]